MLKHYLTTALRHFRQHKLTTAINVVCLTIGLVCFLAIFATVTYMNRADQHFANADRVYIITTKANTVPFSPMGPFLTAKYLKTDVPEIKTVARATFDLGLYSDVPISTKDVKTFVTAAYADPAFLDVFALPFEAGSARDSLRAPFSAVISHDAAIRIFGNAQAAIDQPLRLQNGTEVRVRGVLGPLRQPSHIKTTSATSFASVRFDVLFSMDVLEHSSIATDPARAVLFTNWSVPYFLTYVELPEDGSLTVNDLRQRLKSFGKRHADTASDVYQFDVTTLNGYKLNMFGGFAGSEKTGISATTMFYFLGILVLVISCFNYANLATAQATTRAKEIGMRRVVGASRLQIIAQFIFEAALMASVAFVCALILTVVALLAFDVPGMNDVVRWTLTTRGFWLTATGLLAGVTAAAGIYPAFVLSNVRPIQAVRAGKVRTGGGFVPKLLVGMQFLGASFLLISMLVMTKQNAMLKEMAMSGVASTMVVGTSTTRDTNIDFEVFRTELMRQPHVQSVTAAQFSPWSLPAMPTYASHSNDPGDSKLPTTQSIVNHDFFGTMGIKLLAGRDFERGRADDEIEYPLNGGAGPRSVIVDRAFAEQSGWPLPADALGKAVYVMQYGNASNPLVPLTVIGVVENRPIGIVSPIGASSNIYLLSTAAAAFPIIRIATSDSAVALQEIESVWNKLAPSVVFKMQFADEQLNTSYQTMSDIANMFMAIASLALVISVLGLIGMSIQIIGRRLHEIGVRKTLGASVRSIVRLLLADFSKPVIVANLLAWPFAFLTMRLYLSMFVNQAGLSSGPFIASLGFTVLIAWIAVAVQATRAARLNPATVLRYE